AWLITATSPAHSAAAGASEVQLQPGQSLVNRLGVPVVVHLIHRAPEGQLDFDESVLLAPRSQTHYPVPDGSAISAMEIADARIGVRRIRCEALQEDPKTTNSI